MKQDQLALTSVNQCHEVAIHYKRPLFDSAKCISSSEGAVKVLREFVQNTTLDYKEYFWVILLSNANQVLGISTVAVGTTRSVCVNIREIVQLALLSNASSVIAAHNHTGGTLKPSSCDNSFTEKIKGSLGLVDIDLLDHVILTSEGYYSYADTKGI